MPTYRLETIDAQGVSHVLDESGDTPDHAIAEIQRRGYGPARVIGQLRPPTDNPYAYGNGADLMAPQPDPVAAAIRELRNDLDRHALLLRREVARSGRRSAAATRYLFVFLCVFLWLLAELAVSFLTSTPADADAARSRLTLLTLLGLGTLAVFVVWWMVDLLGGEA